ncbi:Wax ester synthase/diacylglycerol acyltransferase 4-like protein [Drosera capensis]
MENNKADILAPPSPYAAVYQQDELDTTVHFAIGLRNPINIDAIKSAFSNSMITKHPKFTSLMINDRRGRYRWLKTQRPFNLDDHIILYHHKDIATTSHEKEEAVNKYLADLAVSMPLSKDKPLWELHMLIGLDCLVWRVHHSIGDGVSMFSIFLASFGTNPEGGLEKPNAWKCCAGSAESEKTQIQKKREVSLIKRLWWTLEYALKLGAQMLWTKDRTTVIGGDGVELWPRKIVTVKFKLEDIKALKKDIPNVTVNDVFLGLISCALSKYLQSMDNQMQQRDVQISGMCAVNLRGDPFLQMSELSKSSTFSGWGNKTGSFHVPLKLLRSRSELHPLEHIKRVKSMMDRKKQTYEAHVPYLNMHSAFNLFGSKVAASMIKRYLLRTTFLCSNLVGPREEVAIAGNLAISIYLATYAERADVQFMLAKDIIQNPELLAKCFEDSFYEMISSKA